MSAPVFPSAPVIPERTQRARAHFARLNNE